MGGSIWVVETRSRTKWKALCMFVKKRNADFALRRVANGGHNIDACRIVEYVRAPEGPRGAGKEPAE